MKSSPLQKIGFLILIASAVTYGIIRSQIPPRDTGTNQPTNTTHELSSTSVLNEYHATHLTTAQTSALFSDLANVKKYRPADVTKYETLLGDCGTSAKVEQFKKLEAQLTVQTVNGSVRILRTPNLLHWANVAEASDYQNDDTVVCGVGFPYPFEVTSDHVLWRTSCSSGFLPTDAQGRLETESVQCFQVEEAINLHYGYTE